jgi:hypothetical protein
MALRNVSRGEFYVSFKTIINLSFHFKFYELRPELGNYRMIILITSADKKEDQSHQNLIFLP